MFGLAISFGSQSLVRDIVSGIFFLAEDSFRIGEYVDCSKVKGTVEGFSVRSLKLRHQNGQLHIVPFGQVGHITNFSRDWTVVKFNLAFANGTDVELLRKTVKKLGIDMMEEPTFKPILMQPLKMQGVVDIKDNAVIVRFKFTARPKNPSLVQRMAIRRMYESFPALGIQFATPNYPFAMTAPPVAPSPAVAPRRAFVPPPRRQRPPNNTRSASEEKHHGKTQARPLRPRIRADRLRRQRVRLDGRRGDVAQAARRLRRCRLHLRRHRRRLFALGAGPQGRRIGGGDRQLAEEGSQEARQGPDRHQVRHGDAATKARACRAPTSSSRSTPR